MYCAVTMSNSQASSARVVVRRRVRLSWYPCFPQTRGSGAPTGASTIPRLRGADACLARHARLSALHRGGFCRRDCSVRHPDRPFGLIPQASACVRPGASATRRALVVGPGSNPEAPGDGLRNHPQAPHLLRQSRRLMMAPPDEQAATGYRTPSRKKAGMRGISQDQVQELVSIAKNLCVAWDNRVNDLATPVNSYAELFVKPPPVG